MNGGKKSQQTPTTITQDDEESYNIYMGKRHLACALIRIYLLTMHKH